MSLVYTTEPCGFCRVAKALLDKRGVAYDEINLAKDAVGRAELVGRTGMMTFPQVIIDGEPLGGYQQLVARIATGGWSRSPPDAAAGPRPRLAALADVRPAPGGDELSHRAPAHRARRALAAVDEELVLERAAHAVGMAEIVDRGALGGDPGLQRPDDPVAQRRALRAVSRSAGRSGWMRARNSASSA